MFSRVFKACVCLILSIVVCCICINGRSWADAALEKHVLFINSYTPDYPTDEIKTERIKSVLAESTDYQINYSYEYLDLAKFGKIPDYPNLFRTYLKKKYASHPPDLIFADANGYSIFEEVLKSDFSKTPVLLDWNADKYPIQSLPTNITAIVRSTHIEENLELIFKTRPNTKKVYIIIGDSPGERHLVANITKKLQPYSKNINIAYMNKLSYAKMLETVAKADQDSAILYLQWFSDVDGNSFISAEVLDEVINKSTVPVYGVNTQYLGKGIVGGFATDWSLFGESEALQASTLLAGKKLESNLIQNEKLEKYVFDNRMLVHWGVDNRLLPQDSEILYRWNGVLEQYRGYIVAVVILVLIQFILIAALLLNRRNRLHAEQALVNTNDNLQALTDRLLSLDRAKDEFLANTSHELQTPLNGIINISESLLEGYFGEISNEQRSELSVILAVSRRLSSLVKDLVDLERIKRNEFQLNISSVDIQAVIDTVVETFKHLNSNNSVTIKHGFSANLPLVLADENRLWQVLFNMIGNSLKFTNKGHVSINTIIEENHLKIEIEDTGIGISEDKQESIFDAFTQGDLNHSKTYGGSGLGLFISRQLMHRMGGDLWLEWSMPGEGSRFAILLPTSDEVSYRRNEIEEMLIEPMNEMDVEEFIPINKKHTILAVDDEPTNLRVLDSLLNSRGYNVLTAASGEEALNLLKSHREVELVLMDVMMPGLSGYETCRRIRKYRVLHDLPILLLTVLNTPDDIARGFDSGANDFISKPFVARELRARIETQLMMKLSVQEALRNEMAFLQAQIKPHFLYNAMSTIMSFCYTDSERAGELMSDLSIFLHRSYDIDNTRETTTLENELELTRAYTQIEKARFGERLTVQYDVDTGLEQCMILPLVIQPLVENAIRHGLMTRKTGGIVTLSIKRVANGFSVTIEDNGVGFNYIKDSSLSSIKSNRATSGIGISNISWRLKNYYGTELELFSQLGEGTLVRFFVPEKEAFNVASRDR